MDDLIDTVDELRSNGRTQLLFRQVRGHDDERILEVHQPAFVVCQTTVIQHLQQDVEHIRMRFFDFIEQNHRVRFSTNCFGQLTAFVIAYVSGRRTDESGGAEFLLVLTHIDTGHHVLVVEEVVCEGFGQFSLTDTCSAEEDERTDRSFRILQTRPATPDSIADGFNCRVLTDDTLVQFFFEVQ